MFKVNYDSATDMLDVHFAGVLVGKVFTKTAVKLLAMDYDEVEYDAEAELYLRKNSDWF